MFILKGAMLFRVWSSPASRPTRSCALLSPEKRAPHRAGEDLAHAPMDRAIVNVTLTPKLQRPVDSASRSMSSNHARSCLYLGRVLSTKPKPRPVIPTMPPPRLPSSSTDRSRRSPRRARLPRRRRTRAILSRSSPWPFGRTRRRLSRPARSRRCRARPDRWRGCARPRAYPL